MTGTAELIDQGIRAYTRGLLDEAERLWREALVIEPASQRARAYLKLIEKDQLPAPAAAGSAQTVAPAPSRFAAASSAPAPAPAEYDRSPWDDGPALQATIVLDPDGGLDLTAIDDAIVRTPAAPPAGAPPMGITPSPEVAHWMEGARELFALGDFSGSLEMLERILAVDPNHSEARAYLEQNEATLVHMYESKYAPLTNVPSLAIKPEEVMWLNLDHRAGFVLAQIDGRVTFEDLYALSGLPRLDTAKILTRLLAEGVIRGA